MRTDNLQIIANTLHAAVLKPWECGFHLELNLVLLLLHVVLHLLPNFIIITRFGPQIYTHFSSFAFFACFPLKIDPS